MTNVQFCSGGSRIPGWINSDLEHGDMKIDITQRLPFDDNSVDACRIEHGAEHVTTHECLRFFDEVHRILKPGGTFRLCIPVLDALVAGPRKIGMAPEHARDLVFGHGHQCAFTKQLAYIFLSLAGFIIILHSERDPHDQHWKVIGEEKDTLETARFIATK